MATADELLTSVDSSGSILTIDLETRTVTIPNTVKNLGVGSDDDVKTLYFSVPRYYGKFDLFDFDIYINYRNARKNPDRYTVTDASVDGDNIVFSWLIGRFATQHVGEVPFVVCFKKYASDGTTVEQELNTTIAKLPVLEGLETSEAVVQAYPDVLVEWERNLFDSRDKGVLSVEAAADDSVARIHNTGNDILSQMESIVAGNEAYTKYESDIKYGVPIVKSISGDDKFMTISDSADRTLMGLRIFGKSMQAVTTGKNVIDTNTPLHNMNCTLIKDGNGYVVTTTGQTWVNVYFGAGEYSDYVGKTVTLQVKNTSAYEMLVRLGNVVDNALPDGSELQMGIAQPGGSSKITATIPECDNPDTLGVRIIFNAASMNVGTKLTFENLQLEYGTSATEYEPYSGGIESPSPNWSQDISTVENPSIKLYGANLANINNLAINNNTSLSVSHDGYRIMAVGGSSVGYASSTTYLNPELVRGRDVIFKADNIVSYISGAKGVVQLNIFTATNKFYEPISTNSLNRVISIPEDTYEITLGVYTNNNAAGLGSDNTIIAEGVGVYLTDMDWVPCSETQSIVPSFSIPGIPVASGGTYMDSNGQHYICDEIDLRRGVYIQRVGHINNILVDSTGQNEFTESATEGHKKYTVRRNLRGMAANADNVAMGLCNRFRVLPISGNITNNTSNANTCIAWSRTSGGFYVMAPEDKYPTLETFVTDITANPVEVYYVLETPVETILPSELISAYRALASRKPITTILNENGVGVDIAYVADSKTFIQAYVDAKIEELRASMN